MWLRFTIPRYRFDQLMRLGWHFLIPLSIINVLLVGVALIAGSYFNLKGWGLLLVTTPAAVITLVAALLILAAEKERDVGRIPTPHRIFMLDRVLFYFFAGIAVASAVLMVTRRNVVHGAIFLITALLATAGIFLQLRAEFLFIVQIILYVGGIMVLFVFVIMLVNLDVALQQIQFARQKWVALVVALALAAQVGLMFLVLREMPGQGCRC